MRLAPAAAAKVLVDLESRSPGADGVDAAVSIDIDELHVGAVEVEAWVGPIVDEVLPFAASGVRKVSRQSSGSNEDVCTAVPVHVGQADSVLA